MKTRVAHLAAALWWGSLTAIGFLAVPMLFKFLPSTALAGNMAARLFTAQTWVSLVCGVLLLWLARSGRAGRLEATTPATASWVPLLPVIVGLMMALLVEFGVAPRIRARDNLALWHSVGTVMYAVQWLCALAVLWVLAAAPKQPKPAKEQT